jgi:hypothetical protein
MSSQNIYKEKQAIEDRTKAFFQLLSQLESKLDSLAVRRKAIHMGMSDISDIYLYAEDVRTLVNVLIKTPSSDWRTLAATSVKLRVILGEIKDHISHSVKPLDYLADYCYKHDLSEDDSDNNQ